MSQPPRSTPLLALLAIAICLLGTASAQAATCPGRGALEQPFVRFGDAASYYLAPNGSFESQPWPGGTPANGNETFFVRRGGAGDHRSLAVSQGGATSPAACVGLTDPTIRLFANRTAGPSSAVLRVTVAFTGADGAAHTIVLAPIGAGTNGTWVVSAPIPVLANATALPRPDGTDPVSGAPTTSVRFTFTPDPGSAWSIDDVYVDPYQRN